MLRLKNTHNLHILITDENGNIIKNQEVLLEKVYNEIADKIVIKKGALKANDVCNNFEIKLFWKKMDITKIHSNFMGDLFITSPYSDAVLYKVTESVLNEIENKLKMDVKNDIKMDWKISFHISKLLEDMDKKCKLFIL
jgi:hypothetical protein